MFGKLIHLPKQVNNQGRLMQSFVMDLSEPMHRQPLPKWGSLHCNWRWLLLLWMYRRIWRTKLWRRYRYDKYSRFRHFLRIKTTTLPIVMDYYSANHNFSFAWWAPADHIDVKIVEHPQRRVLIHSHTLALTSLKETPAKSVKEF